MSGVVRQIKFRFFHKPSCKMFYEFRVNESKVKEINLIYKEYAKNSGFALMQYVGIQDINGKEIYEGDIISYEFMNRDTHYPLNFVGIVEYEGVEFCLKCLKGMTIDSHYCLPYYGGEKLKKGEIIGNIYQNTELLEVDNEQE